MVTNHDHDDDDEEEDEDKDDDADKDDDDDDVDGGGDDDIDEGWKSPRGQDLFFFQVLFQFCQQFFSGLSDSRCHSLF